jgi:hypothetical protein
MRCKSCDYPLWNLATRNCPECGATCLPIDYEFVINSIRFCCPHCSQAYYGTGPRGHLLPIDFDCVKCSHHIHMNEMILLPTEGVREDQTRGIVVPWLQPWPPGILGGIKTWWRTFSLSLSQPGNFGAAVPASSPLFTSLWFGFITILVLHSISTIPIGILQLVFSGMGGPFGTPGILEVLMVIFPVIITIIGGLLAGCLAHAGMKLTGGTDYPLSRTLQAVLYATPAGLLFIIPCLGLLIGWIWWAAAAAIMVTKMQPRVSPARSAGFMIASIVLVVVLVIGGYAGLEVLRVNRAMTAMAAVPPVAAITNLQPSTRVSNMTSAILASADANGQGPAFALQLVTDAGVSASELSVDLSGLMSTEAYSGNPLSVLDYAPEQLAQAVAAGNAALGTSVPAHRVGGFVFMYHGVDLRKPDPALWLVALTDHPVGGVPSSQRYWVGMGNNGWLFIGPDEAEAALLRQNALRESLGLPPIPDPRSVLPYNAE